MHTHVICISFYERENCVMNYASNSQLHNFEKIKLTRHI